MRVCLPFYCMRRTLSIALTCSAYCFSDTIEEKTVAVSESIVYYPGVKPPLWFVYSGMGSQWAGMGADLMRIPTFAAAIER